MILYFSATGNSKYVAEEVAKNLNDVAVSLEKQKPTITLKEDEVLGIVTPTNWLQLPVLTSDFLKNLSLQYKNKPYIFLIATYGSYCGAIGEDARHILKKKGYILDASYSLKMPDNWTPLFDLSNKDEVAKTNSEADNNLITILENINQRKEGNQTKNKTPYFLKPITSKLLDYERKTKHLYVEDQCIGCSLCEKKCPVKAIEMKDNKPVWVKDKCAMCLGCLHRCPKFAIQYGNGKTKNHGQYKHPKTRV